MLHSPSHRQDPSDPLLVRLTTCLTQQGDEAPHILLVDDLTRRLEAPARAAKNAIMLELAWHWTGEAQDRLPRRPLSCPRQYIQGPRQDANAESQSSRTLP
jgi:hypothetical protein